MHGVAKSKPTEAQLKETADKIGVYVRVAKAILKNHEEKVYSETTLTEGAKMCGVNPDFYTVWNYRRHNLQALFAANPSPDYRQRLCRAELDVTIAGLQRNPKSYCAWHHRAWIVLTGAVDLRYELGVCTKYLAIDSRNFHVWNYRRFVVAECEKRNAAAVAAARASGGDAAANAAVLPFPKLLDSELAFTRDKINENFSNYSAWHHRSVLIPKIVATQQLSAAAVESLLDAEFELVRNAFFTEPTDQSSWLYHRWLLTRVAGRRLALDALGGVALGIAKHLPAPAPTAAAATADGKTAPAPAPATTTAATAATTTAPAATTTASDNAVQDAVAAAAAAALSAQQGFADEQLIELPFDRQLTIFQREIDSLNELVEVEPNAKWVWLTIAVLMGCVEDTRAAQAQAAKAAGAAAAGAGAGAASATAKLQKTAEIFAKLVTLDPMRTHYYEHVQRRLTEQIQRAASA